MAKQASIAQTHRADPLSERDKDAPTLGELRRAAWKNGFKRAIHEFGRHQCTDLAAALTYYLVLAAFPALLALISLLGVISDGRSTTDAVNDFIDEFGGAGASDTLQPVIEQITQSRGAGLTLVIGVLVALWSASGFVNAFSRAMNRIYQVQEGRSFIKLRAKMYLITIVLVIGAALVVFGMVMSGPVARQVGEFVGLGEQSVQIWNIAKWPVMLFLVVLMFALLYYATPNVEQPKFRWLSLGAAIAILVWIVASAGFGFYVANFGNYNKTYGSLAGIIVFLLWLWLTNIAMLFGGVVDAEVERARELQAGVKAENQLQLPPRDTSVIEKKAEKHREVVASSRELRQDSEIRKRAKARRKARAAEAAAAGSLAEITSSATGRD